MNDQFKEKLKGMIQTLHDSCTEVKYESWEPSKEGFSAMVKNLQEIVTLLGKTYIHMYMLNLRIKALEQEFAFSKCEGVETNEWFNCKCTANTRWDIHDS